MRNNIAKHGVLLAVLLALCAFMPAMAFASDGVSDDAVELSVDTPASQWSSGSAAADVADEGLVEELSGQIAGNRSAGDAVLGDKQAKQFEEKAKEVQAEAEAKAAAEAERAERRTKVLEYDKKLIAQIGTQEKTGHTICCPSFSCAYADCVMDGTVRDHSYYTCSCCTWNDWGEGGSFDRCVGSSEELLREAYDQIAAGKPTVIHVTSGSGEHWIALIGYKNVDDPDALTLDNFVALDPWDGAKITASERYSLYGDGCEHISSR